MFGRLVITPNSSFFCLPPFRIPWKRCLTKRAVFSRLMLVLPRYPDGRNLPVPVRTKNRRVGATDAHGYGAGWFSFIPGQAASPDSRGIPGSLGSLFRSCACRVFRCAFQKLRCPYVTGGSHPLFHPKFVPRPRVQIPMWYKSRKFNFPSRGRGNGPTIPPYTTTVAPD